MSGWEPDWTVSPGAILADLMTERGLSIGQVARAVGCTLYEVEAVLAGLSPIDPWLARRLEVGLVGPPATFWLNSQDMYLSHLARTAANIDPARIWERDPPTPVYRMADIPVGMTPAQQMEFWDAHCITPEVWDEMDDPATPTILAVVRLEDGRYGIENRTDLTSLGRDDLMAIMDTFRLWGSIQWELRT